MAHKDVKEFSQVYLKYINLFPGGKQILIKPLGVSGEIFMAQV